MKKGNFPVSAEALSIIYTVICGVIVVALTWWLTALKDDGSASKLLIQVLQFIFTTSGTYFAAKVVVGKQALALSQERARLALRRALSLISNRNNTLTFIDSQRIHVKAQSRDGQSVDIVQVENALDNIGRVTDMSFQVADDIVQDWREIIPDEISAIEKQAEQMKENSNE